MADYVLPEDVRTALMNYLAGKPYRESAQIIHTLDSLKKVSFEIKAVETDKKKGGKRGIS